MAATEAQNSRNKFSYHAIWKQIEKFINQEMIPCKSMFPWQKIFNTLYKRYKAQEYQQVLTSV